MFVGGIPLSPPAAGPFCVLAACISVRVHRTGDMLHLSLPRAFRRRRTPGSSALANRQTPCAAAVFAPTPSSVFSGSPRLRSPRPSPPTARARAASQSRKQSSARASHRSLHHRARNRRAWLAAQAHAPAPTRTHTQPHHHAPTHPRSSHHTTTNTHNTTTYATTQTSPPRQSTRCIPTSSYDSS